MRVIVFMHYVRIIISLPCPHITFYYVISANVVNGKYMRLHTLVSYVLLLALSTGTYGLQHGNCVVRHISFQWQMQIIDLSWPTWTFQVDLVKKWQKPETELHKVHVISVCHHEIPCEYSQNFPQSIHTRSADCPREHTNCGTLSSEYGCLT